MLSCVIFMLCCICYITCNVMLRYDIKDVILCYVI